MSANGDSNKSEFRLKSEPEDGISAVRFGPNSSQFLLVSSWGKLSLNNSRCNFTLGIFQRGLL